VFPVCLKLLVIFCSNLPWCYCARLPQKSPTLLPAKTKIFPHKVLPETEAIYTVITPFWLTSKCKTGRQNRCPQLNYYLNVILAFHVRFLVVKIKTNSIYIFTSTVLQFTVSWQGDTLLSPCLRFHFFPFSFRSSTQSWPELWKSHFQYFYISHTTALNFLAELISVFKHCVLFSSLFTVSVPGHCQVVSILNVTTVLGEINLRNF